MKVVRRTKCTTPIDRHYSHNNFFVLYHVYEGIKRLDEVDRVNLENEFCRMTDLAWLTTPSAFSLDAFISSMALPKLARQRVRSTRKQRPVTSKVHAG